jgi:catechol 2,3-dioxygenase-like lactoylglutathione lyase family enzyme
MTLLSLGYIGVRSPKLADWQGFATGLLGMQLVDAAGGVRAFRMDDRRQRLIVTDDAEPAGDALAFLGWEVADAMALDALAARLEARKSPPRRSSPDARSPAFAPGRLAWAMPC